MAFRSWSLSKMKRLEGNVSRDKNKSSVIKNMLSRGTIHGLKYLFDEKTNTLEKLFWIVVFTAAFIGTAAHLFKVWDTYRTNLTRTTIISTYFKYTNVAFPSVTVCDSSRVDWSRVDQLNLTGFLDGSSNKNKSKLMSDFKILLGALSTAQFGAPKDLNHVKNVYSLRALNEVPISRLLRHVLRRCEQFFEPRCWWRTSWYRCCDLFELQKTGYGYCYSFNSDISEKSKLLSLNYGLDGDKKPGWKDWHRQMRPRRTAGHGPLSGIRFVVNAQPIPSYVNAKPGVVVIVGDPSGFPFENDVFVAAGKVGHIGVRGDAVYTTDRLQKLPVSKRKCLFPGEGRILFRGYLRQNCIANCYRKFVQANCKCSLDFIYFQIPYNTSSRFAPCKMKHLTCLAEYNYAFINHLSEESINNDFETGSFCKCPDDCMNQKYIAKLFTTSEESPSKVLCDVHFERSFCSLYRTDISFDYMDALVSYGGIFGLFLGASLLSLAEIIYHISKKILSHFPGKKKITKNLSNSNNMTIFFKREFPSYYNDNVDNYE